MFSMLRDRNPLSKLTAASRITLGLVSSMLSILILADLTDILPDRNDAIRLGRKQVTESLAFSAVVLLATNDVMGLDIVLENTMLRSPQIRSIGVRQQSNGKLVAAAGDHDAAWPKEISKKSSVEFMHLPLKRDNGETWGEMEVAFQPDTWLTYFKNSIASLLLFAGIAGFAAFRVFLKVVLKNLDPSRAVPRRVREALDILNEGLMIVSVDDRILLANNSLANTAKRDADSLVGRRATELHLRRTDGEKLMPWTQCGQTQQSVSGVTMEFDDPKLERRIFKANCSPLFGNEGQIRGVMVSLDDVTQLEQNKIELKLAKDEADAANKAKGDFLANMSHEIRNPMNAIVGFTDILRRGLEDSDATRTTYLDTIHASGTHLVELINDILDFSKIEAGKLELEVRECNPYQLMMEVVNVMKMKAKQQSLDLSVTIEGCIPETIHADPTRLRQILMNLVSNAIKFTQEGSVRIIASMLETNGRPFIRFDVKDTGIGMTKEQMGRLFQEFMQADSSVTRRFGGTGLGLAISKRLAEAMGGKIAVDSAPGVGSTFCFSIETGSLASTTLLTHDEITEKYRTIATSRKQGLKIWFKPARVLITDDTPANRQLAGLVLRKAGLTVDEAENGAIAVEKASTGSYSLMLMDMQMPVMDGFTATRTLRERGLKTPILAFTANVMEQDRQRCVAAGCTGFLTKPINIDLLLNTIAEYLPTTDFHPTESVAQPKVEVIQPNASSGRQPSSAVPATTDGKQQGHAPSSSTHSTLDFLDDLMTQLVEPATEHTEPARKDAVRPTPEPSRADTRTVIRRQPVRKPIYSMLPLDIPEFRKIVESFVNSIDEAMRSLRTAQRTMDYSQVREIAHRLKGTGGTVGFADFTEPSRKLQHAAEIRDDATIEAMLSELEDISARIEVLASA
jgi:signal transduction histidine kinase/DNA-binding NarL/FixJ family response regulator/HPt (histidine-containing phosphotransfer) domain-containing protein